MALKTERPVEKTAEKPVERAAPPVEGTTVLELALYKIYTWGNITYEQGKPYRFKNTDAITLLSERDLDRPIWKLHKAPRAKQAPRTEIVDATMISAPQPVDEFGSLTVNTPPKAKRIDVGTDDEIQDILSRPEEDSSGDVTV